jgi:hypothetical protein
MPAGALGGTPTAGHLYEASRAGHVDAVRLLLITLPTRAIAPAGRGGTALYYAAGQRPQSSRIFDPWQAGGNIVTLA